MQAAPGAPLNPEAGDAGGAAAGVRPVSTRRRRVGVLAGVAAFVLAADAITKALVVTHLRPDEPVHVLGDVLMLDLLRNPGAAFSVGTGDTIVFTAIAVGVVIYIARTARNLRSVGWAITLGLLLGGAIGNLADRIFRAPGLFRGNVVDWIELTRYWPVFNIADSAIVCGGILTVLLAMFGYHLDGTRGDRRAMAAAAAAANEAPAAKQAPAAKPVKPAGTADAADADR
jgi:signal peptidase II